MEKDLYISLLQKQLSGTLTPEEQNSLDDWLAAAPDHPRIARSVRKAWDLGSGFTQDVELDADADFDRIQQRIDASESSPGKVVPMQPRRRWLRVAAAVLLLAAAPFLLKNYLRPAAKYEVAVTGDQPRSEALSLPDGSKIWLNTHSRLSYFITSVSGERRVKLEGEAFFEVAKNPAQPFVVETSSGEVTVLGTHFNVSDQADALTVSVEEGKVKMQPTGSGEHLILTANEQGVFDKKMKRLIESADATLNDLAWHTQRLVFESVTLEQAAKAIGELYQVRIEIANPALRSCPLTVTFDKKPLTTVLNTLQTLLGADVKKQDESSYVLLGGRCR